MILAACKCSKVPLTFLNNVEAREHSEACEKIAAGMRRIEKAQSQSRKRKAEK